MKTAIERKNEDALVASCDVCNEDVFFNGEEIPSFSKGYEKEGGSDMFRMRNERF